MKPNKRIFKLKNIFIFLCGFISPFIISFLFFFIKTGDLPSPFTPIRRYQIASSYFGRNNNKEIVIRPTVIHSSLSSPSWVIFQKDTFFQNIFGLNPDELGLTSNPIDTSISDFDSSVIILEDIELGIFTPIVAYLWPFDKKFQISISDLRLFDVLSYDLDADGAQELIVHWLDYAGGSGGTSLPLVLKFKDPYTIIYTALPLIEKDEESGQYILVEGKTCEVEINKKLQLIPCNYIHADIFWCFKNLDEDENIELIIADPQSDWDFHYGPQSWIIAAFEFKGSKFIPDPNFEIIEFSKELGYGLPEIHGYSFVPAYGQILFMWLPSWATLEHTDFGAKGRKESQAIIALKNEYLANQQ